jgi:phage terminase large subunit
MCSFDGATPGAFWGKVMSELDAKGRITTIERDPNSPLIAALDLGHSDLMPVIFMQEIGNQPRILGCETYQFTSIPDMVRDWQAKGLAPDRLILPHDAKVTELGTGQTRQQVFRNLGVANVLAPNVGLMDGIEQARTFLNRCWFNRESTTWLREALSQYRSEYDEIRGVHRLTPIHDQASHYADAFRYLAVGNRDMSYLSGGDDYRPKLSGTY